SVFLKPPKEFDFSQCLKFLARSFKEPCHVIAEDTLFKLLKFDDKPILLKIQRPDSRYLGIDFLTPRPKKFIRAKVAKYVWQWFDLETNLKPFYRMAKNDSVLKHIAKEFFGLRILVIHDLFEALCWAIIGQQINLEFAYTLKQRFVENFGEKFHYDRKIFYLFPTPQTISQQAVGDLKRLQFTGKKSEYIIELAGKFKNNEITKNALLNDDNFETARRKLMHLRGIGKWSTDYVCLRCLGDPAALPVDDVGLQNAIRQQLGLNEKPTPEEILRFSAGWKNWQAYAAFYLWRSLI
ncbi:MAG: DNA-3-methyladenine glycosylase, partial [Desulfobacterales bacterium]